MFIAKGFRKQRHCAVLQESVSPPLLQVAPVIAAGSVDDNRKMRGLAKLLGLDHSGYNMMISGGQVDFPVRVNKGIVSISLYSYRNDPVHHLSLSFALQRQKHVWVPRAEKIAYSSVKDNSCSVMA